MRHAPAAWRFYRAVIGQVIGWPMQELMALPWDEFLREFDMAVALRKVR